MMGLNGDVGESYGSWTLGKDEQLIPLLDMANIACGFHASDPETMAQTVQLCKHHNVSIGAHPGYEDKVGFGRRSITMSTDAVTTSILYQVGALNGICQLYGCHVDYIKPHGAMYLDMMHSASIMQAIFAAAKVLNLPVMLLANRHAEATQQLANSMGVSILFEAFADRLYLDSGELTPRSQANAVFHSTEQILGQANRLLQTQTLITASGSERHVVADSLCVHGDNEASIEVATAIRAIINQTMNNNTGR
ncbi:5-oxoprolinase subunit PxpA [Vibrio methylphosphonaticus]|uniref:5-oxoprolinase subunit PxpA n=1 Tax=Vibrio methylphosphonaticus TaxID=2946866 RepID=UPI002029F047|nr:5-oxoprolinase subunit PxpA [Vibrio methylphosphonaticus]MCL9773208.1 LamB/YcsF family protein [Vibrio methylphosphonaticus]